MSRRIAKESRVDPRVKDAQRGDPVAAAELARALIAHDAEGELRILVGHLHACNGWDAIGMIARYTGRSYSALIDDAAGPSELRDVVHPVARKTGILARLGLRKDIESQ